MKQKVQVCNVTTEHRFTEVIKRRLTQGRLPPDLEFEFYSSLKNQESYNNGKSIGLDLQNKIFQVANDYNMRRKIGFTLSLS